MSEKNRVIKGATPEVLKHLPGCIAYPPGSACPIGWCRKNRGDWCKDWRTGKICQWKKI